MNAFDDIERRREANEGAHPAGPDPYDEEGDFSVRVVFLDGVDRVQKCGIRSLRSALHEADEHRAVLRGKGYDHRRVHVGVIDSDDPERGELDWDVLS